MAWFTFTLRALPEVEESAITKHVRQVMSDTGHDAGLYVLREKPLERNMSTVHFLQTDHPESFVTLLNEQNAVLCPPPRAERIMPIPEKSLK